MMDKIKKFPLSFLLISGVALALAQSCGPDNSVDSTESENKPSGDSTNQPNPPNDDKPKPPVNQGTTVDENGDPADDETEEPEKPPRLGDNVNIAGKCVNEQLIVAVDLDDLRNTKWTGRLARENADKALNLTLSIDGALNVSNERKLSWLLIPFTETWAGKLNADTPSVIQLSKPAKVFGAPTVEKYTIYKCDDDNIILFKSTDHNGTMLFNK